MCIGISIYIYIHRYICFLAHNHPHPYTGRGAQRGKRRRQGGGQGGGGKRKRGGPRGGARGRPAGGGAKGGGKSGKGGKNGADDEVLRIDYLGTKTFKVLDPTDEVRGRESKRASGREDRSYLCLFRVHVGECWYTFANFSHASFSSSFPPSFFPKTGFTVLVSFCSPSFLFQVELWIEFRRRVPRGKEVGVVPLTYRLGKPSGQDQADVAVGLMEEVKTVNGRRSCRSS